MVETKTKVIGKGEIIEMVAEKSGSTKKDATLALNMMLEAITENLQKGNSVRLIPFGTFEVRERKKRTGRNPRTNAKITIPARKVPAFKPGKALKDAVRG